jgi:hypothetical protein
MTGAELRLVPDDLTFFRNPRRKRSATIAEGVMAEKCLSELNLARLVGV